MEIIATLGLVLLLLFVLWGRFQGAIRQRRNRGKPVPDLDTVVGDDAAGRVRLLLYFYDTHCGKCRGMTPVVERLAGEYETLRKVDVDVHRDWAIDLGISTLPSLAIIDKGRLASVYGGALSEPRLRELLERPELEQAA